MQKNRFKSLQMADERIDKLVERQIETATLLNVAQQDINKIGNAQRQDTIDLRAADERIESKTDDHATEFKIIKIIMSLIGSLILGLVYLVTWIIDHIDVLRDMTK
jgi:hypothetical protein